MLFTFVFVFLCLIVFALSIFHVPSQHVKVIEWSVWIPGILRQANPDHVIARLGEQGIEARHYMPGWNWRLFIRVFTKFHQFPFVAIPDDHVMVIMANDGEEKPAGAVFGTWMDPECLTDGERFLRGGQRGPQAWVIGPGGTKAFNHLLFRHQLITRTLFLPAEIDDPLNQDKKVSVPTFGLVTALVGEEIAEGPGQRLLGRPLPAPGCNNFENTRAFLEGIPDPTGTIVKGQRGPQQAVIEAGAFLHPLAFRAESHRATVIPQGFLGVRIQNIGDTPKDPQDFLPTTDPRFVFKDENGAEHKRRWVRVLRPKSVLNKRGIRPDPYHPGTRIVSPWVERIVLVDTTEVKVCFDKHTENKHHPEAIRGPMHRVITAEGLEVTLHIELVTQVPSKLASMLVSLSGDFAQSINDFVAPTSDRIARVIASRTSIEVFISERDKYGKEVEKELRVLLGVRYLDLVSFNITEIEFLDEEVKKRLRATTDLSTLKAQVPVQKKRKEVEKLTGEADAARPAQVTVSMAKATAEAAVIKAQGENEAIDKLLEDGVLKTAVKATTAVAPSLSTIFHGDKEAPKEKK